MPDPNIKPWGPMTDDEPSGYNRRRLNEVWWRAIVPWGDLGIQAPIIMHEAECRLLWEVCADPALPNGPFLEIGTGFGGSLVIAAKASERRGRGEECWTLDSFPGGEEDKIRPMLCVAVANHIGARLIHGDREVLAQHACAPTFRIAFIDGGHSSEDVWADMRAVLPLMLPGSTMLLHDCWGEHSAGPITVWQAAERSELNTPNRTVQACEITHSLGRLLVHGGA
jgi:cephalosporin hydroxylase